MNKLTKSVFAIFMAVLIAVPSIMTCFAVESSAGNKDEGALLIAEEREGLEVLEVSNVKQFEAFAKNCKYDLWSTNKKIILTADINLLGINDCYIASFGGIFDGNGHTISNLKMSGEGSNSGLFRYVAATGNVMNLKVSGEIAATGSAENIGGIAGTNMGTIYQCSFDGKVSGKENVGGIVGNNKATGNVIGCTSTAEVKATDSTGGIAGTNAGVIKQCTNQGAVNTDDFQTTLELGGIDIGNLNITQNIASRSDMGGVAGFSSGMILESSNHGKIGFEHAGYNVGGVVGRQAGTVVACTNDGEILGRKDVGGIVGQAEPFVESEYLSDLIDETTDQINALNTTAKQIGQSLSDTSAQARTYTESLIQQYNQTLDILNNNMNTITGTVRTESTETQENINSVQAALEDLNQVKIEDVEISIPLDSDVLPDAETIKNAINGSAEKASRLAEEASKVAEEASKVTEEASREAATSESTTRAPENTTQSAAEKASQLASQAAQLASQAAESATTGSSSLVDQFSENAANAAAAAAGAVSDSVNSAINNAISNTTINTAPNDIDEIQEKLTALSDSLSGAAKSINIPNESVDTAVDNISNELKSGRGSMSDSISSLVDIMDDGIQTVTGNVNSMADQMKDITSGLKSDAELLSMNTAYIEDISSVDTASNTQGVISGCENRGKIAADINVGGVVGCANIEYDIDPEQDLDFSAVTDVVVRTKTNDVIIHCINYGSVEAKKNNSGAIVGLQELGLVYDAQGYGNVKASAGDYLGGIAGASSSSIANSYSFSNLTGKNYIGGIAGSGYSITDCRSMSVIDSEGEALGSIAGEVKEEGNVARNYFVSDTLGGIDDISYAGMAEPCTYTVMMASEEIPEGFTDVTVTFQVEDTVLAEKRVHYNAGIADNEIPAIPEKEGFYARWPIVFDFSSIINNVTLEAEYVPWTTSISSVQMDEKEHSYMIASENFYTEAKLELEELPLEDIVLKGNTPAYAYQWKITANNEKQYDAVSLHLLIPDEKKKTEVWYQNTDGQWTKADYKLDGKYAVSDIPMGAAVAVVSCAKYNIILIAVVIVVILVLATVILRFQKKKHKNSIVKNIE